jgi:hypothetical protein
MNFEIDFEMDFEVENDMNFNYEGIQFEEISEYQIINPLATWIVCDGDEVYEFNDEEYENYKFQKSQEIVNLEENDDENLDMNLDYSKCDSPNLDETSDDDDKSIVD